MLIAASIRILLSEQTFGSTGLLTLFGLLNDQMVVLNLIIVAASIAGLAVGVLTFRPHDLSLPLIIATALIAIGAFMDADASNATRPSSFYMSQGLIGFASLLFLSQAAAIGLARVLLTGGKKFITFIVLFSMSQSVGGLAGTALLGTFQTVREKFHSHELVQSIVMTDPLVAARVRAGSGAVANVIGDPVLRGAEGVVLLSQQVGREANILAYNDVFLLVAMLAVLATLWGIVIRWSIFRRREPSPIVLLQQRMMQARAAQNERGA
jgi:hypothetical protein